MFVRPTTFSLDDREKEETGVQKGLNLKSHGVKSYDSDEEDVESTILPRAPVSPMKPKGAKQTNNGPKMTKTRDTKAKPVESGPKETKSRDAKSAKKTPKKQKNETKTDESDAMPEILSLEGSPVIAGRRMFRVPSDESLEGIGGGGGGSDMKTGREPAKRGSPELPVFDNGSRNLWMEQPNSAPNCDGLSSSGGRVQVLPTPQHEKRIKSPPPIVKPKPVVAKKPQALKPNAAAEQKKLELPRTTERKEPSVEREEEKPKNKKTSRFSKLYTFAGVAGGSPKKTKKDAPLEKRERREEREEREKRERREEREGREKREEDQLQMLFGGAGVKDVAVGDWDVPGDGRKSPILQGRRG